MPMSFSCAEKGRITRSKVFWNSRNSTVSGVPALSTIWPPFSS